MAQDKIVGSDQVRIALLTKINNDIEELFNTINAINSGTFIGLTDTPDSYTAGQILFMTASEITGDSDLQWDNTNKKLTIGSNIVLPASGNILIGTTTDNGEKLQINGAILLGNSAGNVAGTIRWSGSDFEGYDGSAWKSLTTVAVMNGLELLSPLLYKDAFDDGWGLAEYAADVSWATKTAMPTAREGAPVGRVESKAYVITGNDGSFPTTNESYNRITDSWSTSETSAPECHTTGIGFQKDNDVFICGGYTSSGVKTATCKAYSTTSKSWTTKTSMPASRSDFHRHMELLDGIAYVIGGNDGSDSTVTTNEAYTVSTDSWATKASMSYARYEPVTVVHDSLVYVIGGTKSGSTYSYNEAYNPSTDSWSTKASLPTAVHGASGGSIGNYVYVAEGVDSGGITNVTQKYDPSTDSWSTVTSSPYSSRRSSGIVMDNQRLYLFGGYEDGGDYYDYNRALAVFEYNWYDVDYSGGSVDKYAVSFTYGTNDIITGYSKSLDTTYSLSSFNFASLKDDNGFYHYTKF